MIISRLLGGKVLRSFGKMSMKNMQDHILEKIYKASLKFLVPQTPEEVYQVIVEEAVKLVDADFGSIVLEQNGKLVKVYSSSEVGYQVKFRKNGFTYQSFKERKIVIAPIFQFGKSHADLRAMGIRWSMFIPLSYHGKAIGTISVNSKRDKEFTKKEQQSLELLGSMASLAIRRSQLYSETQKALEARDLFISMAAHEFRTPVTTIYGYAQLLYNRKENLPEAESRWAEGMHTESYRLTLMMNDLLEINRIKSGRMQFDWKECSLRYLMTRTVNNFKFNYPDREIVLRERLQENEADYVIGDHDKLLQVFTNILDNAAKFSKHDTKVIFDLCSKGGNFIISIKDSGTGISKKDLPRIFEGYYRGRDANREGMGLGLFLAKNIVDEHHGFIHIHSKVNKGTTVEVHLPKAKI